jgi:hypothetical protein
MGGRAKVLSLLIHVEGSLSHRGHGVMLVPPSTRGSVSVSRGARRNPSALLYTRKHLSVLEDVASNIC